MLSWIFQRYCKILKMRDSVTRHAFGFIWFRIDTGALSLFYIWMFRSCERIVRHEVNFPDRPSILPGLSFLRRIYFYLIQHPRNNSDTEIAWWKSAWIEPPMPMLDGCPNNSDFCTRNLFMTFFFKRSIKSIDCFLTNVHGSNGIGIRFNFELFTNYFLLSLRTFNFKWVRATVCTSQSINL